MPTGDWQNSVGKHWTRAFAQDICRTGDEYTMTWKLFMRDYYDWDPNDTRNSWKTTASQEELYYLHVYGRAQNFMQYGMIEKTVTWKDGER